MELAGLTAHLVGPPGAITTAVLLHGFGAPGDDLVPLARELGCVGASVAVWCAPRARRARWRGRRFARVVDARSGAARGGSPPRRAARSPRRDARGPGRGAHAAAAPPRPARGPVRGPRRAPRA